MKKAFKFFVTFCLMFVISFSLISCSDDSETEPVYSPPAGVDMTSGKSFATWLYKNHSKSASYQMKYTKTEGTNVLDEKIIKYKTDNGSYYYSIYDKNNTQLYFHRFFKEIDDYKFTHYDVQAKTYVNKMYNSEQLSLLKSNYFYADSVIYLYLYDYENLDSNESTTVTTEKSIKTVSSKKGEYLLTNVVTYTYADSSTKTVTYQFNVLNNKITSLKITTKNSFDSKVTTEYYTYSYQEIDLSIPKGKFTELTDDAE